LVPKDANAYNNRGNSKYNLGRYQEAIEDYNEAIRLDPKHEYAYNSRGYCYFKLGYWQKAIEDYDKQIGLNGADYDPGHKYREAAFAKLSGRPDQR
jgi:tetratricopeptide (TPR) repeat protein